MLAQIAELVRAQRNVKEGIDITNTANGAIYERLNYWPVPAKYDAPF